MFRLTNSEELVGLNAQPPPGVRETVLDGKAGVLRDARPIHRLKKPVLEVEIVEAFRLGFWLCLRIDELQLLPGPRDERSPGFRADAQVVDAWRHLLGPVGLDCYLEPGLVQGIDQWRIELQERLAARADDVAPRRRRCIRGSRRLRRGAQL